MKLVYLRSAPLNNCKINTQEYNDVRKMANSYVYDDNDRIKKICSKKDQRIQNIIAIQSFPNTKPLSYQIFLIDPDQNKIKQTKKKLLQIAKNEINQLVEEYTKALEKIQKSLTKI